MAEFITNRSLKAAAEIAIKAVQDKLTSSRARAAFSRGVRAYLVRETNFAIGGAGLNGKTVFGRLLNPKIHLGDFAVGQLGVGTGSGPDNEKLKNGWFPATVLSGGGKVNVSFQKSLNNFGKYRYTLDFEKFYKHPNNIYKSFSDGESVSVEWMRNYIEGVLVDDHDYVERGDRNYRNKSSRTKIGHMIPAPGNVFKFPGIGTQIVVNELERAIERRFNTQKFINGLREEVVEIIRTL